MLKAAGLMSVQIGPRVDTFHGASGEAKARQFGTYGVPILAVKPGRGVPRVRTQTWRY